MQRTDNGKYGNNGGFTFVTPNFGADKYERLVLCKEPQISCIHIALHFCSVDFSRFISVRDWGDETVFLLDIVL